MIGILRTFRRLAAALMGALAVLWLPKDIQDASEALTPWQGAIAMVDQNTALWVLVAALIAILAWSDGRNYINFRRGKAMEDQLAAFRESRTRFTIKEAACLAVGILPSQFDTSLQAQGEASEMLYYAREGLIRPSVMTNIQYEAMKGGKEVDGYSRESITLDSYITKQELEQYVRPGWKTWLPVLDDQRQRRS
jgi:hypothetical protein